MLCLDEAVGGDLTDDGVKDKDIDDIYDMENYDSDSEQGTYLTTFGYALATENVCLETIIIIVCMC